LGGEEEFAILFSGPGRNPRAKKHFQDIPGFLDTFLDISLLILKGSPGIQEFLHRFRLLVYKIRHLHQKLIATQSCHCYNFCQCRLPLCPQQVGRFRWKLEAGSYQLNSYVADEKSSSVTEICQCFQLDEQMKKLNGADMLQMKSAHP